MVETLLDYSCFCFRIFSQTCPKLHSETPDFNPISSFKNMDGFTYNGSFKCRHDLFMRLPGGWLCHCVSFNDYPPWNMGTFPWKPPFLGMFLCRVWLAKSNCLVVWNMPFMTFHSVGNVIIPTDLLCFFRGVGLNHQPMDRFKGKS